MSDENKTVDPALYYRRHVFMCTNHRPDGHPRGCCAAKDAEKLRSYLKNQAKKFGLEDMRINGAGCLDRCELGPAMVIYPEGVWYTYKDRADLDEILSVHLKDGGRVTHLQLRSGDDPPKAK